MNYIVFFHYLYLNSKLFEICIPIFDAAIIISVTRWSENFIEMINLFVGYEQIIFLSVTNIFDWNDKIKNLDNKFLMIWLSNSVSY